MRMAIIAKTRDNINPNPKVKGEVRSGIKAAIDRPFAHSYFRIISSRSKSTIDTKSNALSEQLASNAIADKRRNILVLFVLYYSIKTNVSICHFDSLSHLGLYIDSGNYT